MLYGTFVRGSVDSLESLLAATSDTRTGNARTQFFPPVAPHRRISALTLGLKAIKPPVHTSLLSPKSIQFLSGMSVMPLSLGKPPCRSVSPVWYISSPCVAGSPVCVLTGHRCLLVNPSDSVTSLQIRLFRARSTSLHITECGLMTKEGCSLWS